ncbi:hypothetical protein L1987_67470 [Smallanthus sonchifolius]|uniref:Uncharacterized protein n=1 Tax=Smallanthus sonchifolius TaxID=185202 RepID=A0ACB9B439_9ASTR|nr:hypothetical protein L1987_67470 [Smallanthus sonchifolius]
MAPSRKSSRTTLKKKKLQETINDMDDQITSTIGCTTPKAQKYRIPEVLTCPPAPKKRRIVSTCTLRRTPISFFDPPDIELFFASHLASVYNHVHTHFAFLSFFLFVSLNIFDDDKEREGSVS